MFLIDDGDLVLSATDLTGYLACEHLLEQRRAVALGERGRPRRAGDPHGELVAERGLEHERAQLERLGAQLGGHVDLTDVAFARTRAALEAAAARTERAMRAGAPLLYQAQLFDGTWHGRVDFLRRVDVPSDLGGWSYEVLDTKLARAVKPHVVHQLSLYARLLARVQGHHPERAHVVLGDGTEAPVELGRYAALHRHVAARLRELVHAGPRPTYPEPVAHCAVCDFAAECDARRRADDHLSLVAGARRDQRDRLVAADVGTVARLAAAPSTLQVPRLADEALDLLHGQAALQVVTRTTGDLTRRHLAPERARGYARLPALDPGDVYFDLEGDPYAGPDGGLEYLWGWWTHDRGYECAWAHDRAGEKRALEAFVDFVVARRAAHPGLRVFHYAPHEASALKALALRHGTREEAVDDLLRNGVLVDLYAIVRQALQVGEESYSLKRLERHHGFVRRETTIRAGGGSIVAYERWLRTGDEALLAAIRAYNEDDCRSTQSLRAWLHGVLRPEAEDVLAVHFAELADPAPEEPRARPAWLDGQEALAARLSAGLPEDEADDDADQAERRLLARLLLYHHRESKPQWWRHFELLSKTAVELVEERDAVGLLRPDPERAPVADKQSLLYSFTFPPQEVKLDTGRAVDPATGDTHTVWAVEDDRIVLRRSAKLPPPAPTALIPPDPVSVKPLREALARLARSLLDGDGRFPATRAILRREPPRLAGGARLPDTDAPAIEEMCAATLALDRTALVVQGPPGTGKTYRGARMVVAALRAGKRVGLTAQSHAAIQNLLAAVEDHADEIGFAFRGVYKGDGYETLDGLVECVTVNEATEGDFDLVAGTAWLFAREAHCERLDLLVVDEAGQFALADAALAAMCARDVVLLGDQQQLAQVTQAEHPGGSGVSVLEHLLDGRDTVARDRGFFLGESWRLHPAVCAFVSERSYDGRLRSRAACAQRRVSSAGSLDGAGLRYVPVAHEGCSQRSDAEADAIAALCRELLRDGRVTDEDGVVRELRPADVMVVAPYNLAVTCIRRRVPAGVQVGTVDRFQGREAPVVFFAMTCSSGDDVPRGLDFLFDAHRINVAVSRAQCLAVLVASPRLLDADCRTLEAMALVDGACRFVELATVVGGVALAG